MPRLVGVGESLQAVPVGDSDKYPLDDDIETPSAAVVASGQRHPAVVFAGFAVLADGALAVAPIVFLMAPLPAIAVTLEA
jgi:hypothetical protein